MLMVYLLQADGCAKQVPSLSQRLSDEIAAAGLVAVGQTLGTTDDRGFFEAKRGAARCWGQMTLHGTEDEDVLLDYLCSDDPLSSALLLPSGANSRTRTQADGCRAGDLSDCVSLGLSFERGQHGLRLYLGRMMRLYDEACSGHDALGCVRMARHYTTRTLIPPDPQRALDLFSEGCESGLIESCSKGLMLGVESEGIEPDSLRLLARRACLQEHADGCNTLGVMRHRGVGGDVDRDGAALAFRDACQYGSITGCENLNQGDKP